MWWPGSSGAANMTAGEAPLHATLCSAPLAPSSLAGAAVVEALASLRYSWSASWLCPGLYR